MCGLLSAELPLATTTPFHHPAMQPSLRQLAKQALRLPQATSRSLASSAHASRPAASPASTDRAEQPHHPVASTSRTRTPASHALTESSSRLSRPHGSNPAMSFPCVDQNEIRTARLLNERRRPSSSTAAPKDLAAFPSLPAAETDPEGPEPAYANVVTGYQLYHHPSPFPLDYGGHLPSFSLAYETWGTLNATHSNVVLIHTGLSASSHAHSTPENPAEGWWEKFIGAGKAIDTDKFFVICTNVLGGCYGSTGPGSLDPLDGLPYATRFPVLSIFDMVRAQFHLLTELGVDKVYASVGSSMGGMQSIAAAYLEPERVGKVVSISGTARSSPASIAMRHAQRSGAVFEVLGRRKES